MKTITYVELAELRKKFHEKAGEVWEGETEGEHGLLKERLVKDLCAEITGCESCKRGGE